MSIDRASWQPFREPLRNTLLRTGTIALVAGAILAWRTGGLARWPMAVLLMLWPAFGGHWVELLFLNFLRQRISASRVVQIGVRLTVWFMGGVILMFGMRLTAMALAGFQTRHSPAWWVGGVAFIGIELFVHSIMRLRGLPNFYDGRG